jgi:predicted dithiol-disulfide oxidoreductase (DUF899 family)
MNANDIEQLEMELLALKTKIAEAKRSLPRRTISDYAFKTHAGDEVVLSDLFGDKSDLILVHNMGTGCPYCTLWADGFIGVLKHLENRAAFVVVSPDAPQVQRKFHEGRGWNFRMLSAEGTTFNKDMGFEDGDGGPLPGVTTFHKRPDGQVERIASAPFGPGDDFCIVWPFLDLLATGQDGWEPKYKY